MKSIKNKLFFAILLIILIFLTGIFIYSLSFKPFYINSKIDEINMILDTLDEYTTSTDFEDNINYIYNLSDKYNLKINVVDKTTNNSVCTTYNSFNSPQGNKGNPNNHMNMNMANKFKTIKTLSSNNGITTIIIMDNSTNAEFLQSIKNHNTLNYVTTITTPISAIDDNIDKSLSLLLLIMIPISLLSILVTLYFSNKFTKPIIEITEKASKIKNLDFSTSLNIKSKDEISILASTINNLSHKIEKSLYDLRDKNLKLEEFIEFDKKQDTLKKEFISSVSHELKSPITVISGYAQALDSDILTSKENKQYYLKVIQDEATRMEVIVNDLLDLYKLQSNTFKIKPKEVNLDELLTSIIDKLSFKFDDTDIKLSINIEKARVIADPIRLEQAITNYISNALSHINNDKIMNISLNVKNNKAIISIFNSGKQIPISEMNNIWTGFVRLDKVRNYKDNRVGLGLAIVDQIISLHNGSRGVNNIENGVEFWLSLDML